jgi:hypothetical protein
MGGRGGGGVPQNPAGGVSTRLSRVGFCIPEWVFPFGIGRVSLGVGFAFRNGMGHSGMAFALDFLREQLAGGFAFGKCHFSRSARAMRPGMQHASRSDHSTPLKKWSRPTGFYPTGSARKDKWF